MRFAYIDSNGNEVPIPSVDALALRIELGAISEDTQLYDAQADQWGPAHSHEIFHTLQRDTTEGDGFVAPPPVAPPPVVSDGDEAVAVDETSPDGSSVAAGERSVAETPTESSEEAVDEAGGSMQPGGEKGRESASEPEDESFGLTLAEPTAESVETGAPPGHDFEPRTDAEARDGSPDEDTDLGDLGAQEHPGLVNGEAEEGGDLGFDFDMGEAMALDEVLGDRLSDESGPEPTVDEASRVDFGGEMEFETAADFDMTDLGTGDHGGLDLETPMSEFSPGAPPSWMDDEAEDEDDDAMDFSTLGTVSEDEVEDDLPLRERRTPRNKPSKPKLRARRNNAVPLFLIAFVVAVGVGGYVAWPLVSDRLLGEGESQIPAVTLPPLSEDLMPTMRSVSDAALAAAFEDVRREWAVSGPVDEPPEDWLAGVYLANASGYPAVEEFWSAIGDFLDGVRRMDLATYDAKVAAELSRRSMSEAEAAAIRARADSGFVAGAPDRQLIYDRFSALVDASLDLHRFLVANEADIAYVPASAITTDPVLEVNPATAELREAMERLLDAVTDALSGLEYRERITAAGLREALRRRMAEQGTR